MPCYSPLKGYKDGETGGLVFKSNGTQEPMEVACGQCVGCRLDRSRMWATRIVHEASLYDDTYGNSFVTLTYRDKELCTPHQLANSRHIPDSWSLSVPERDENGKQVKQSHFQAFMKRLRKKLAGQRIKYFQCGEYGSICRHGIDLTLVSCPLCNLGRPHHHAILLGVQFGDLKAYAVQRGTTRYTSETLERLWGHGFVDVGTVTKQSAGYVARYCLKKITGDQAAGHYQRITEQGEVIALEPEYASMSNGIGRAFFEKYRSDFFPSDEVPVPGHGVQRGMPRYYDELNEQLDPEEHEEVKARREQYRRDHEEEYESHRLMAKYNVKKAQVANLKRG